MSHANGKLTFAGRRLVIDRIQAEQLRGDIPKFRPGDTVRVHATIVEGDKERVQVFEGVCTDLPPQRKR